MILRKPYAFLIKYFKTIHIILVLLMSYLLYSTNVILNFFQEYIVNNQLITGKDFTGQLFNTWMFALPFIIIVILVILLGVMYYKKKPLVYYVYNIIIMIALLVIYNIGYDTLTTLETQVIETRALHLVRDFFMIIILFQSVSLIFTFIRATGFDIKKFDFGQDLEELNITELDNEEFEVDVDFETNVFKRELNKHFRFVKYFYVENKFIINIIILITFSIICFNTYMSLTIYNKTYNEKDLFLASDFTMSVDNSYLTNEDYLGNKITDNYLLILELNLQANYDNTIFNTTKAQIKIGNHTYYPKNKYSSELVDLGYVYDDKKISMNDFSKKLLVYEIPKSYVNEKITFKYIDDLQPDNKGLNVKYISVKVRPYNLDLENKKKTVELNTSNTLNENIFGTSSFNLNNFEIQERFKIAYKHCNKDECYDSFEYLNPTLNTNYDKVLLKINGNLNLDEEVYSENIGNLYDIIYYFGKIKYMINNSVKYYTNLRKINPSKVSLKNSYYIEIPKDVMSADNVSLIFEVRDQVYEYIIK